MTDWKRKHVGDIAAAARNLARDPALEPQHRERFDALYRRSKQSLRSVSHGCDDLLAELVAELCSACKSSGNNRGCSARAHWLEPCTLLLPQQP